MQKLVECVPNFSEGKNLKIINAIFNSSKKVKKVKVFELEKDPSHNRMLFTIVGEPQAVLASVYKAIKTAVKLIDMNKHHGEHPRVGATDVVPFVPVSGVSMSECVALSNKLAKKVAGELKIPVFMYEESAKRPENKNLADVRKGEFEKFKKSMPKPDYGPGKIHPTAGAIVIGARKYLIAYNVNLDTSDIETGKKVASSIREKNGGLKAVKAMGFEVGGKAQVSMNLVDYKKTNFDTAYREIEKQAKKHGVKIISSEIYGMIPLDAIIDCVKTTFKANTFKVDQVLETRLYE